MKRVLPLLLVWILAACGTDSHHFRLEGRLLHMNQAEFYVYSPDGAISGLDTIKVMGGRFTYEIPCEQKGTLMIVFPNFYQQPIFAEPGKSVSLDADASKLKEMKVDGQKDNELMNKFRQRVKSASPPEMLTAAQQFIEDHPKSIASVYLFNTYYVQAAQPDYKEAQRLLGVLLQAQPDVASLLRLQRELPELARSGIGKSLPAFTAADINGRTANSAAVAKAPVGVVFTWASWDYQSTDLQRQLKSLRQASAGRLQVIGVNVDASRLICRQSMSYDSIPWPTICDEQMFSGPVPKQLALRSTTSNLILQNGRIVARDLQKDDFLQRLRAILGVH